MADSDVPRPSRDPEGLRPAAGAGHAGADEPSRGTTADPAPSRSPSEGRSGRRRRGGRGSFLKELPVLLLIAFVLAFLLRTFVLQVFYIPSSSMEPTLQINDRMVVEKVVYRVREPQRGEVVVFEGDSFGVPANDRGPVVRVVRGVGQFLGVVPASARDFVKRVIGLPGDEIVIEDGRVFVNGEELEEPYVRFDDRSDHGPVTVPDGHLFFLGDNRPNSSDSRRALGFVPREHVVGRAVVVIWPPAHLGSLTGILHDVPDQRAEEEPADEQAGPDSEEGPVGIAAGDAADALPTGVPPVDAVLVGAGR